MTREHPQIDSLKEKAKDAEKNVRLMTVPTYSFNKKTLKLEKKQRVIRSGKEGNSFKRIAIILTFIGLELIFFIFTYVMFISAFLWFLFIPYGIGIIFACRVAVSGKNADSKIAWILFLLILAPIAFLVYLIAGEFSSSPIKAYRMRRINQRTKLLEKQAVPDCLSARVKQDCSFIQNTSDFMPHYSGDAEYFPIGEDFFEDVLNKLRYAEKFIFMDFFILEEGHLATALFEVLTERARAGVDVRIIVDGLGSHGTLSFSNVRRMKKHGIKIIAFEPVLPIASFFINYRNHRKIIVIDGTTGYVGGTNIADEYINAKQRHGVWKDASMRIDGSAVQNLTLMFLRMWEYSAKEKPDYELLKASEPFTADTGDSVIIPYGDGVNEKKKLGKGVYANIISNAQKSLYIMTPYFIIDSYIIDLLKAKAQSGVDVRIIIPEIPDKKIIYALTLYNAEKLIASGVRIYTYTPGFLHSKVMLSDDECAVVGSINVDYRSFYQQYESAAYITQDRTLRQIDADFTDTFGVSREVTADNMTKRNIFKRVGLAVLQLLAPLM